MSHTQKYVAALQREFATGVALEHAYRPALKTYLESLLPGVHAVNDPKRQKCGAPDYVVSQMRKGRTLTVDDLRHYQKIIVALVNTDRLMKEIDAVWKP